MAKTHAQFSHRISQNFSRKLPQKCICPASYKVYGIFACDRFRKLEIQTKYCARNVIPAGEDKIENDKLGAQGWLSRSAHILLKYNLEPIEMVSAAAEISKYLEMM